VRDLPGFIDCLQDGELTCLELGRTEDEIVQMADRSTGSPDIDAGALAMSNAVRHSVTRLSIVNGLKNRLTGRIASRTMKFHITRSKSGSESAASMQQAVKESNTVDHAPLQTV